MDMEGEPTKLWSNR